MKRIPSTLALAGSLAAALAFGASSASAETLIVGMRSMPPGEGNPYTGRGIPHVFLWVNLFDNLTEIGPKGVIEPMLAESWSNDGNLTWTFKLRPGLTFSNGEPVNAEAIKATYDWLASEAGSITVIGKNMTPVVDSVTAVDDLTVQFKTKTPLPTTAREVAGVHIVAPKAWADMGVEAFAKKPVGSGPYSVESFSPGAAALVAREDQSGVLRKITGNIDRIEYVNLEEAPARNAALLSGQIHLNIAAGIDDFETLRANGFKIDTVPAARTLGFSIVSYRNGAQVEGPMGNVKVRQALNYAVNKQAIIDEIYGGNGRPATQAATTNAFGYNPDIEGYPYNPEKAKQLLAEAGYPNGFDMEVRVTTSDPQFLLVYQAAGQDIQAIGVNAKVVGQTFAEWLKHWLAGDWPYEAFGFGHDLSGVLDAGTSFTRFTSCMKKPPYYCNPDEIPMIEAQAQEFDPEKRLEMLQELLAVHTENAPIVFLTEGVESMSMTPKLKNFKQVNQVLNYHEMVLED